MCVGGSKAGSPPPIRTRDRQNYVMHVLESSIAPDEGLSSVRTNVKYDLIRVLKNWLVMKCKHSLILVGRLQRS